MTTGSEAIAADTFPVSGAVRATAQATHSDVARSAATLIVSPAAATRLLGGIAATLVLIAIGLTIIELLFGYDNIRGIVPMFTLTMEANVPTWFSGALLLTASTLLFVIGHNSRGGAFANESPSLARYWFGLAAVFAYLSFDELTQFHERTTQPVRDGLGTSGILYYGWIIPALVLVGLVGLVYLRFLFRIPRPTARLFVIAAALYVGGAIGGEMLEGLTYSSELEPFAKRFTIKAITITEEAAEMSGVIVFIRALLLYVARWRTPGGAPASVAG